MERDRRRIKSFKGVAARTAEVVLLLSAIPLSHPENTVRAFSGAFLDQDVSCAPKLNPNPNNPQIYPFDAIVVPGAGSIKLAKGIYEPNIFGEIRLAGAAMAYADKKAPEIIVLDGKGSHGISEGNRAYLQQAYRDYTGTNQIIPDTALRWDKKSLNTSGNMEELAKLKKKEHLRRVLDMTNRFHQKRANQLGCEYGIGITSRAGDGLNSAEDFVIKGNPENETEINKLYMHDDVKKEEFRNWAELAFSIFDPESILTSTAVRLQTDFDSVLKTTRSAAETLKNVKFKAPKLKLPRITKALR